jgi:hypothetical protein
VRKRRLPEVLPHDDETLVCYVELTGNLEFPAPSGTVTYHKGYELFDAHTGNLLMAGGF